MFSTVSHIELFHITACVIIYFTIYRNYEWEIFAKIMVPGCNGLPWGLTNLLYCLVQGVTTSTSLSCVVIGMGIGVSVFEVSITAELFPWKGVLLADGVLTGECSAGALFTSLWHWGCRQSRLQWCVSYSLTISWRSIRSSCMVHVSN